MGKRRGKKKKKRVQSDRHRKQGHESGPEATGGDQDDATGSCSPAWNSLDEESLLDYAQNAAAGESGEEGEVAKLLSYLNFSVIPCALEPRNLDCEPHAQGPAAGTDVDLLSELTSATHHERDADEGGEGGGTSRENRKRASRRRPNKRAKKLRCSASEGSMHVCQFVREGNLPSPRARGGDVDMNSGGCERCWEDGAPVRGKARRRSRGERFDPLWHAGRLGKGRGGSNRSESTTPVNLPAPSLALQCWVEMECENLNEVGDFLTDTSATAEVNMGAESEDSDHTPPADPDPVEPLSQAELYEEESDLSDSSSTDRWGIFPPLSSSLLPPSLPPSPPFPTNSPPPPPPHTHY